MLDIVVVCYFVVVVVGFYYYCGSMDVVVVAVVKPLRGENCNVGQKMSRRYCMVCTYIRTVFSSYNTALIQLIHIVFT